MALIMPMSWLKQVVLERKAKLAELEEEPMDRLARECAQIWEHPASLDVLLEKDLQLLPYCHQLYVLNKLGIQISSTVTREGIDAFRHGKDLSAEPYLVGSLPYKGYVFSPIHINKLTGNQCITLIQAVHREGGGLLGFIAADFDLSDLPMTEESRGVAIGWHQFSGDPVIRSSLFHQVRSQSPMDDNLDRIIYVIDDLLCNYGIFHCKLHYSSSRATMWSFKEPYNYQIHDMDEILSPDIFLAYEKKEYPIEASIPARDISLVLQMLAGLRLMDESVYLRSASINIMNGLIGLTFSCDGSHYMSASELLEKGTEFWYDALTV